MLSIPLLLGVIFVAALLWFWQDSLGARERANFAAQGACERMGLQFLDGTVAFANLALSRNSEHRLCLRRTYIFDYTAGSIDRLQGFVLLLGKRVESIGFASDAHTGHAANQSLTSAANNSARDRHPDDQTSGRNVADSKILDLNEWRQRRRLRQSGGEKQSHDTWQ